MTLQGVAVSCAGSSPRQATAPTTQELGRRLGLVGAELLEQALHELRPVRALDAAQIGARVEDVAPRLLVLECGLQVLLVPLDQRADLGRELRHAGAVELGRLVPQLLRVDEPVRALPSQRLAEAQVPDDADSAAGRQAVSNGAEGAADDGRGGGGSPVGRQRASSAALFWAVSKSGKDHHGVRRGEAALRVATYTQCATRRVPLSLTGASTLPQAQKGTARGARRFLTLPSFGRRPLGSRDPSPIVLPSALGAGAGRNACLRGAAVGWQFAHEHAGCGKLAVGVAEDPRPSRFVCSAPLERTGTRVSRAKPHLFAPHPRRHAACRAQVSLAPRSRDRCPWHT